MRLAAVIALACLATTSSGASGASEYIRGRLQFYPQISGSIQALVNVYEEGDAQPKWTITVNSSTPYEFLRKLPADRVAAPLELSISVLSPGEYVAIIPRYRRAANVNFNQVIPLRRRADAYLSLMQTAPASGDVQSAQQQFEYLTSHVAETPAQQLEAFRAYARWTGNNFGTQKQLAIFNEAYNKDVLAGVGEKKKTVYWQERLDSFLRTVNFNSLKMPVDEFGEIVFKDAALLKTWNELFAQYKKQYPETPDIAAQDPKALSQQLNALRQNLHRQ